MIGTGSFQSRNVAGQLYNVVKCEGAYTVAGRAIDKHGQRLVVVEGKRV